MSHLRQVLETLKEHQLLGNLKRYNFSQQPLVYIRYVIGGGELNINPSKMEAIMKWLVLTNVYEVSSFIGETKYLKKFITSFSTVEAPLHSITASGKSFQWEKVQQMAFEEINKKIIQALVLALPNLQRTFEEEIDASGYTMGVVLIQGGRLVCYHSELFYGTVLNYHAYEKDLYAMV